MTIEINETTKGTIFGGLDQAAQGTERATRALTNMLLLGENRLREQDITRASGYIESIKAQVKETEKLLAAFAKIAS